MENLIELYQETVLDHSQAPRKSEKLPIVTNSVSAKNPLCGDVVALEVFVESGIVKDVSCQTNGCAISTAAGSIMAEEIVGMTVAEAVALCDTFISALKSKEDRIQEPEQVKVLCKVADYPMRIKCAMLPWNGLKKALTS